MLSPTLKESLIQEIKSFDAYDASRRALEEARNELEAFTYKARELLDDQTFMAASTEQARQELSSGLSEAADWLYADGYHASLADVQRKLGGLKELQKPILNRRTEATLRPELVKALRESIEQGRSMMAALRTPPSPPAAEQPEQQQQKDGKEEEEEEIKLAKQPYTAEELDALDAQYTDAEKWLDAKVQQQEALAGHDEPVLLLGELRQKGDELQKVMMDVIRRKMAAAEAAQKKKAQIEARLKKLKDELARAQKADAAKADAAKADAAADGPAENGGQEPQRSTRDPAKESSKEEKIKDEL